MYNKSSRQCWKNGNGLDSNFRMQQAGISTGFRVKSQFWNSWNSNWAHSGYSNWIEIEAWDVKQRHSIWNAYMESDFNQWQKLFEFSICSWHFMRHIATCHWFMDWQKYPKSRTSIRIRQPETLDSKACHTFPGMGGRTLEEILLHDFKKKMC